VLSQHNITSRSKSGLAKFRRPGIEIAREKGVYCRCASGFVVVDALTRLSAKFARAGERGEADERAGRLLALGA
jgi:hypothetical protein